MEQKEKADKPDAPKPIPPPYTPPAPTPNPVSPAVQEPRKPLDHLEPTELPIILQERIRLRSVSLSYSKDLVSAGMIGVGVIGSVAMMFEDYMNFVQLNHQ